MFISGMQTTTYPTTAAALRATIRSAEKKTREAIPAF